MFSKKQLILISFVLAVIFHFAFYFNLYGPSVSILQSEVIYLLPLVSSLLMIFVYLGTYWRKALKGERVVFVFDILIIWIFVCFIRSMLEFRTFGEIRSFLFSNYLGLSLFPVLFFIPGINITYFRGINKILSIFIISAFLISLPFINYFELQLFLLLPIFYLITTIPLRRTEGKFLIILITISIIVVSFTNRAGILRILISYCILGAYYLMQNIRINKRILNALVILILMLPVFALFLALKGQSIFQIVLGEDVNGYSQLNPYADTRTFLYYEVFQDLNLNNAFIFGKGLNAGYASESFETFSRQVVEVGFLQIILKTGIVGFILYASVVFSAILKALRNSMSLFVKALGLLLAGYLLVLFIENIIAYNLLNIVIWFITGLCHSKAFRNLNDQEIRNLFIHSKYE